MLRPAGAPALEDLRALLEEGRYAEAETQSRAALVRLEASSMGRSVEAARILDVLVASLTGLGRALHDETLSLAEQALQIGESRLGPDHLEVAESAQRLATVLRERGSYPKAIALYERALEIRTRTLGPNHLEVARTLDDLVLSGLSSGKGGDAKQSIDRSLAIYQNALGPDDPSIRWCLSNLAHWHLMRGDLEQAGSVLTRALSLAEKGLGLNHPDVGLLLASLAVVREQQGRLEEATPLYERALTNLENNQGRDHPRRLVPLNNYAWLLSRTGRWRESKARYAECLEIARMVYPPGHAFPAWPLFGLARLSLWSRDNYEAKRLCEEAVAIWKKRLGPTHGQVGFGLTLLADIQRELGDFQGARSLYDESLVIFEASFGPDSWQVGVNQRGLGRLFHESGDMREATRTCEHAVAILERRPTGDPEDLAEALNTLGATYIHMARFGEARSCLDRALEIRRRRFGPSHPLTARTLESLAVLDWHLEDFAEAKARYLEVLEILTRSDGPDSVSLVTTLDNLGLACWKLKELEEAKAFLERALGILRRAGDSAVRRDEAKVLSDLGTVLCARGERSQAKSLYERALSLWRDSLGPEHPHVAMALQNLGACAVEAGEIQEAIRLYQGALEIRRKAFGSEHPHVASVTGTIGILRALSGEHASGPDLILQGEDLSRSAWRLRIRSLAERQAVDAVVNRAYLDFAVTIAATTWGAPLWSRVWDSSIRSRALVLDEMAGRRRDLRNARDPRLAPFYEGYLQANQHLSDLLARGPGAEGPERYRGLLSQARKERESAERELAGQSASFRQEQLETQAGLQHVAQALPPGSALVAYILYAHWLPLDGAGNSGRPSVPWQAENHERRYCAFVLRAGEREPVFVPIARADVVDSLIAWWRKEIIGALSPLRGAEAEAQARRAGARLREVIWDPVRAHFDGVRRVFVVPDGGLSLINLYALPSDGSRYLVEGGPLIHSLSAERDLVRFATHSDEGSGLLAVGDPAYDDSTAIVSPAPDQNAAQRAPPVDSAPARPAAETPSTGSSLGAHRFGPLPGAAAEVASLAEIWRQAGWGGEVTVLSGPAAREVAFRAAAPGKRMLHLSTHGIFLEPDRALRDTPPDWSRGVGGVSSAQGPLSFRKGRSSLLLSGLALAGANHRSEARRGQDDGILTAEEVAALDLAGVKGAVLSACDTALGELAPGEGVFGLRRAFHVAGARTLVMSLWPVDDQHTLLWMRAFYEGYLLRKLEAAEAVRRASLTVLDGRREKKESGHPFFWAAFVAEGDWR